MRLSRVDDLARDPVGRYVAGESFAHFCAAPTLWGLVLLGRPDENDALALGRSLVLELAPPAQPHASIVDASRLQAVAPTAFAATERYLERHRAKLSAYVERLALVRPHGLGGAIIAGAYDVLPRPYPVTVFGNAAAAFAWLAPQRARDWPDDGARTLAELYAEASGTPPVVGALRAYVEGRLGDATIAAAATALATSERTLQRKLGDAGTTFQHELAAARIRVAKRLLLDENAALTAIAFDVGCSSLQHFSALFRKLVGESPSAFRARHRSRRQ
jgi:AraC-like DNA-binding protein